MWLCHFSLFRLVSLSFGDTKADKLPAEVRVQFEVRVHGAIFSSGACDIVARGHGGPLCVPR